MRSIYIEKLHELKDATGMSFIAIAEKTGISDSTLCRWFQGKGTPSIDDLEKVFECLGGSMETLFAAVGRSEMQSAEKIDYKGTDALLADFQRREQIYKEHCEQRVQHQIELRQSLQQSFDKTIETITITHNAALEKRDHTYERSVEHLKGQIIQVQDSFEKLLSEKDKIILSERGHVESYRKGRNVWRNMAIGLLVSFIGVVVYAIWELANPYKGLTGILLKMLANGFF